MSAPGGAGPGAACELLRRDAAGLAALPAGDPDRRDAFAHAASCPGCLRALREAEQVLRLLEQAPPPPAPGRAALRRASQQIVSELAWLARQPAVRAGAVLLAWVSLVALAGHRAPDGWPASIALAGAAALIAAFLGALPAAAAALALAAAFIAATGGWPGLAPGTGVECFLIEQVAALVPLLAVLWLARKTGGGPARALVPAAAAGALAGDAALHLACPARHASAHLWAFHFSGILVATLVAVGWSRLSAGRAARAPPQPAARA